MDNISVRIAHRIIRELSYVLAAVPRDALPTVAKGLAQGHNIPTKTMLKVMNRYTRLYR